MSGIKVVFGCGGVNPGRGFSTEEAVKEAFDILEKGGCTILDTARLYGQSEEILGKAGAVKRFTVDTKTKGGFTPGGATKANIEAEAKQSKDLLGGPVDIYYIHAPDANTPLDDTLSGINEIYKSGFFRRFGLSNYKAEDVQKVYDHCKAKGYVLPTAYQGNYNAIARKQETLLFPTLRKLGIAFYAYSPLAGGFLTKTKEQIKEGAGRFNTSSDPGMYTDMYSRPSLLEALADWHAIAKEEGVTTADLAYRWVKYNSPLKPEQGDAIIIGARDHAQLKQTLDSINGGPLSEKAVKKIDEMWKKIEQDAPLDNYHR
ncbi:hypothetical protein M409DRAFT_17725 [Zasmidium cellare ATCC 36951]|uniref:NADP-dependent oxidoreductase domain-containing protein n=1 Tax=Zasmidium cellare ATCC 36951 TaxID=1080233 RepID=A0A6A6CZG1_ZASCE|nr:uncharacterized protein M409DRAFT_17725 [Zasmidium cellare ATCC 36951]KAF2172491.1 hypothetical protein M409DRAFT_17725 [Zasmidium cellare ATCC 36951]